MFRKVTPIFAVVIALHAMTSSLRADAVWKVRDIKAKSKFTAADVGGEVPALKLKLESHTDGERMSCVVIDETAGERAVTLALCWPLDAVGGTWFDNPENSRKISAAATQPYANLTNNAAGVTDEASLYPIGVIAPPGSKTATVIACPVDAPRMMRFVYDATARELRAEIDFGLSPIPKSFPSRADATVIQYEVPAKWAFREALQKYYEKFPEAFARRVKSAGIWLPFGETGPIKDTADFGFAFHEIAEQQAIPRVLDDDQRIGCGSYLYIEPQTYWQNYKGKDSGSFEQPQAQLEADANAGYRISQATLVSGVVRSNGKRDLYMEGVPYTTQLPWGQDPDPNLPAGANGYPSKATYEFDRVEPHLGWRDKTNIGVDGIYIDSMVGWGELKDYDHDHWRATQFPLTFDPMNHNHVALLNFWGVNDFIREMSERLHKHGMILFGNDAFYRRWQLAPWVDVPGREYTWTDDAGKFFPIEEEHLLFLRSMAGKKPYLILMNNKYDDGSIMEPYFQRCLFYANFPAFSGQQSASDVNYFSNPAWYDRDRPLFKKYPDGSVDSAGWEPVPSLTPLPSSRRIERYGSFDRWDLAFTIHNTDAAARDVMLQLDRKALKIDIPIEANEWLSRQAINPTISGDTISLPIHLEVNAYGVIGIERRN